MQKRHPFYWILLSFTALSLIIISFHLFLLRSYAEFFTINNYKKGADAILILDRSADTRAKKAIELYRNGYASEIIITQPKPPTKEYQNIFISDFENLKYILNYENVNYKIV